MPEPEAAKFTVSDLLNECVRQFNGMYVDEEMEREATFQDCINMIHIATIMGRAIMDRAGEEEADDGVRPVPED